MTGTRDMSRCDVCGAGRGIGATVTVRRPRGEETRYVCATCAGRVMDVLYGRNHARA